MQRFGRELAQLRALHLAAVGGLCGGQLAELDEPAGHLEGGEARAAALERGALVEHGALARDGEGDRALGTLVLDGDDGRLGDVVVALEEGLDLARADEEAAQAQRVAAAGGEGEAVVGRAAEVARAQEPVRSEVGLSSPR